MRIIKNEKNYLLKNDKGEYHLSIEAFEKMGRAKAIELATKEIDKKFNSKFQGDTINFSKARDMGFCDNCSHKFNQFLDKAIEKDKLDEAIEEVKKKGFTMNPNFKNTQKILLI